MSSGGEPPPYRGHTKHKNRPTGGAKGTLCPEWTHKTPTGGFADDPYRHPWEQTEAATLFAGAEFDLSTRRRYATADGIAFEAKPTNDGTWHGYPIPWESVPGTIRKKWLGDGRVTRKQIKEYFRFDPSEIHWALAIEGQ